MPGLATTRSCQRSPRPRCCTASFQSESPRFTITGDGRALGTTVGTTPRFGEFARAIAGPAAAGGCAGATGTKRVAGGRDGAIIGGAAVKNLGRAKGERFTGG